MNEPLTIEGWIDLNADGLRGEIITHLENVTSCNPMEVESATRMIFTSIRQWDSLRSTALETAYNALKGEERRCGKLYGPLNDALKLAAKGLGKKQ